MPLRLNQQFEFIREIDRLKLVLRMSTLIDGSRRENTAEHSWHFAVMVSTLAEHSDASINLLRTAQMALVHDLVEIDAGDTYCYDEAANVYKGDREIIAAKRLFALLPQDQGQYFWDLWTEFEEGKTAEARFARALDRLNPFMLNFYSGGLPWKTNGIRRSQALKRMGEIEYNVPKLWAYVMELLNEATAKGWIVDDSAMRTI
jgi:putative hydrolase of HD superfamily